MAKRAAQDELIREDLVEKRQATLSGANCTTATDTTKQEKRLKGVPKTVYKHMQEAVQAAMEPQTRRPIVLLVRPSIQTTGPPRWANSCSMLPKSPNRR